MIFQLLHFWVFKGGTCAYFFYALPRFSVDLDFDLLSVSEENKELVFKKIITILSKYGQIKDQRVKRFTIFALLSYGDEDYNIKVEVNVRKLVSNIKDNYEYKEYLGIPMFVAKKRLFVRWKNFCLNSEKRIGDERCF